MTTPMELAEHYRWLAEPEYMQVESIGLTISAIRGLDADACIRAFGGDPAHTETATAIPLPYPHAGVDQFPALVVPTAALVVLIELSGMLGSIPGVARRASASGGEFFSVFWNINGVHKLIRAHDGRVDSRFDVTEAQVAAKTSGEAQLPEWATGVDFDVFDIDLLPQAVSLALMEQVTGTRFQPHWLTTPQRVAFLTDPATLTKDISDAWRI